MLTCRARDSLSHHKCLRSHVSRPILRGVTSKLRDSCRTRGIYSQGLIGTLMTDSSLQPNFIELAADIVSAYVSNNSVAVSELPGLITDVHAALLRVATGASIVQTPDNLRPAVPVKKSIAHDYIVCLEDGKKFKSLKRHLRTQYNMTPEEYREKWSLPTDYPMVAPNYAQARSQLAKEMGLGSQRRRTRR